MRLCHIQCVLCRVRRTPQNSARLLVKFDRFAPVTPLHVRTRPFTIGKIPVSVRPRILRSSIHGNVFHQSEDSGFLPELHSPSTRTRIKTEMLQLRATKFVEIRRNSAFTSIPMPDIDRSTPGKGGAGCGSCNGSLQNASRLCSSILFRPAFLVTLKNARSRVYSFKLRLTASSSALNFCQTNSIVHATCPLTPSWKYLKYCLMAHGICQSRRFRRTVL